MFGSSSSPPQRVTPQGPRDWRLTHYNGNIYDPKPDGEVAKDVLDTVILKKPKPESTEQQLGLDSGVNTQIYDSNSQTQSGLTIQT
tara:strand:+ start:12695 stop:12952 length:258 start_codon:yes stop_codon:yes gene_type:complete